MGQDLEPNCLTLFLKEFSENMLLLKRILRQQKSYNITGLAQALKVLEFRGLQGAHPSGKSQGNLVFLKGQGKVREFCKMVREIRKSSKVREF